MTMFRYILTGLAVFVLSISAFAADLLVKKDARVAVVGDSITEQKLYSLYIEMYLTACQPQLNARVCQFGWGGEQAEGFARRMENDLMPFNPTVVTTCYGMNDGWYRPFEARTGEHYEQYMRPIVSKLKEKGATVIVGGPGVADSYWFHRGQPFTGTAYNQTLGELDKIARKVADDNGMPHADVYASMLWAMEKGKAALGEEYAVAGRDGVHPGRNGHLVMAYAFLKGMGLNGNLGIITVDMKGTAESSCSYHKVLSASGGKVEIESTRYPFCFSGDEKDENGTRSILPFVPFNKDLNRLTLKVTNCKTDRAKVTWGNDCKEFRRADLEKGINLAAEFIPNPFNEQFFKVEAAAFKKECFETDMIKNTINRFAWIKGSFKDDAEMEQALNMMQKKFWDRQQALSDEVRSAIVPVKHTVVVEPVESK